MTETLPGQKAREPATLDDVVSELRRHRTDREHVEAGRRAWRNMVLRRLSIIAWCVAITFALSAATGIYVAARLAGDDTFGLSECLDADAISDTDCESVYGE
jgi:hypothetical protein